MALRLVNKGIHVNKQRGGLSAKDLMSREVPIKALDIALKTSPNEDGICLLTVTVL